MALTVIVHVFRAVCRLTSVLLFSNLPHDHEHKDPGVGITKQLSSPTDVMVEHISSHTIRTWVHNPFPLVLLKLTSKSENWAMKNQKGGSQKWISGNTIYAFCSIPLPCSAVSNGDPAPFLLPILSQCSSGGTGFISKTWIKNKGMVGTSHCLFLRTMEVWFFFFWTTKENLKKRKTDTSQETGWGEMFMDVGKSTVQLSHVKNYTVCKAREGTLLETKMILDLPVTSPMNLNSYFFTKTT